MSKLYSERFHFTSLKQPNHLKQDLWTLPSDGTDKKRPKLVKSSKLSVMWDYILLVLQTVKANSRGIVKLYTGLWRIGFISQAFTSASQFCSKKSNQKELYAKCTKIKPKEHSGVRPQDLTAVIFSSNVNSPWPIMRVTFGS